MTKMGSIYQYHSKRAKQFQRKMGIWLLALLPVIVGAWFLDIYLEWQYILGIIASAVYGFFVFFYLILRMVNK